MRAEIIDKEWDRVRRLAASTFMNKPLNLNFSLLRSDPLILRETMPSHVHGAEECQRGR